MKLCGFEAGIDQPLFLIAGPCVIESRELAMETAGRLQEITGRLGVPFIYKSSFDKANRSSIGSFSSLRRACSDSSHAIRLRTASGIW